MPRTKGHFYHEDDEVPVYDWLQELRRKDRWALATCLAKVRLLAAKGHELRRPHADYLRDGIYELRARRGRVNYRILYFFDGQSVALLSHALTKEKAVPNTDIDRAIQRKKRYEISPTKHRATIEVPEN